MAIPDATTEKKVRTRLPDARPDHFETQMGFVIQGASVRRARATRSPAIPPSGSAGTIRRWQRVAGVRSHPGAAGTAAAANRLGCIAAHRWALRRSRRPARLHRPRALQCRGHVERQLHPLIQSQALEWGPCGVEMKSIDCERWSRWRRIATRSDFGPMLRPMLSRNVSECSRASIRRWAFTPLALLPGRKHRAIGQRPRLHAR